MKKCKVCKIEKELTEFHPCGQYKDKIYYRGECRSCNKEVFGEANKEACTKYRHSKHGSVVRKEYKQSSAYRVSSKKYEDKKRATDPSFKLKRNLRDRLNKALKAKSWKKNTHFREYIGCSLEELKNHLESQFNNGMNWSNHGKIWQIDHIQALGTAQTDEEMYKLCHYLNLKPLLIAEHSIKSKEDTKNIIKSKEIR